MCPNNGFLQYPVILLRKNIGILKWLVPFLLNSRSHECEWTWQLKTCLGREKLAKIDELSLFGKTIFLFPYLEKAKMWNFLLADARLPIFFSPKPCTYTSWLLNSMAWNYIYYFLIACICKIMQFIVSGSILFLPPDAREAKVNHLVWAGIELGSSYFTSDCSSH